MAKRARISASDRKPSPSINPELSPCLKEPTHTPSSPSSALSTTFKVVVGTYEKLLYGLEASAKLEDGISGQLAVTLTPIFIFPAHVACVRAVAASPQGGKWLATGSTDEIIKVWDLRRRKEIGGLVQHQGSITHLSFPSRSHLLSASEDGTLGLFSSRDWVLLRTLKGHKGKVNDVAMHPSGKLALSVLQAPSLAKGETVRWSVSGTTFAVQSGSTLDIFQTDMKLVDSIIHPSRIHSIKYWQCPGESKLDILLVAAEDTYVTAYLVGNGQSQSRAIARFGGHTNRVKALDTLHVTFNGRPACTKTLMSTASSDGHIRVYDLGAISVSLETHEQVPILLSIASYDTKGSRLVCLTMADRGRDRRSEPIEVRMSKTLSYILRHGAAKEGLAIRSDGYVRVADLLARPKLKDLDLPGLVKIVQADQKQRYRLGTQLSFPDGPIIATQGLDFPDQAILWVRANQGHTLKVDELELKPVTDPSELPCVVHGTTFAAWESISL
ncbi:RNA 2'-phosphotransferase, Tpt1/KptA family protein [Ceratobasidium sp. AG-Ba]|nr:RNA 2'-phosphotransferase, Tpt1/KptA family protein [Ceratobasidium sp. AG-Ba]